MSFWKISNDCIVDDNTRWFIKGEKRDEIRNQCWIFLMTLLEAKKESPDRIITDEILAEVIWKNNGGWDYDRKDDLDGIVKELRRNIGKDVISRVRGTGYRLAYDVVEVFPQKADYYENLWNELYNGKLRDDIWINSDIEYRELIDFYVLPQITLANGELKDQPFSNGRIRAFITAGSGVGKTALLKMMALVNMYSKLKSVKAKCLSENSNNKSSDYLNIKNSLFGENSQDYFPVFIHSSDYNDRSSCDDILELAVANCKEYQLSKMIEATEKSGELLFLVDALDEVKSNMRKDFLDKIIDLLNRRYPKANLIITSRYIETENLPITFNNLSISKLDETRIKTISKLYIDFCLTNHKNIRYVNEKIEKILEDKYWFSLAQNPYMLLFILDKSKQSLCDIIEGVVDHILKRRWGLSGDLGIDTDNIKLLLGGVACCYVFNDYSCKKRSDINKYLKISKEFIEDTGKIINTPLGFDDMIEILSSRSGILNLNIDEGEVGYVFQDSLVMCWLASYYIKTYLICVELQDAGEISSWKVACFSKKIINSFFSNKNNEKLTSNAIISLVMALYQLDEAQQKGILYFLLFKDTLSLNEVERSYILQGYYHIKNATFGENQITIKENSPCSKMIDNAIEKHKTDKTTKAYLGY